MQVLMYKKFLGYSGRYYTVIYFVCIILEPLNIMLIEKTTTSFCYFHLGGLLVPPVSEFNISHVTMIPS